MEKPKIRPLATPKSFNLYSPELACNIMSKTLADMQSYICLRSDVFLSRMCDFAIRCGDSCFISSFFYSTPNMLEHFHAQYVKTRNGEDCLFRDQMTKCNIYPSFFRNIIIMIIIIRNLYSAIMPLGGYTEALAEQVSRIVSRKH